MTKYTGKRVRPHWGLAERLAFYTAPPNERGCCEWTATRGRNRYGYMRWKGKNRIVSRLTWEAANGPIPEGLDVLHTCDNPPCRTLEHLFLGTHLDNMADMKAKGRAGMVCGASHGLAKLTDDMARNIRSDPRGPTRVARDFGVSPTTVRDIKVGRTWRHLG